MHRSEKNKKHSMKKRNKTREKKGEKEEL